MGKIKNTEKRRSSLAEAFKGLDFPVLITAIVASAYGLMLVYSASYSSLAQGETMSSTFKTMLITVLLGICAAVVISMVDYQIISKLWPIIAAACIVLMIITYFFGVGPSARSDVKSWLDFGAFTIQTSEFLKVGFIISFSYHLDLVKDHINKIKTIIPLVIHGAVPTVLTLITGDAGSALIFLLMFIAMLFLARVNIGYFIAGICLIIVGFVVAWQLGIIDGIQRQRIVALFYPESYADIMYQQSNGKIALGSGGLFGQGYLQGEMTQGGLVPENVNDMILTVAGEELGFVGALAVILVLGILIARVFSVGLRARDNVGYLMCAGVFSMLFAQLLVNVGMELSLLPCIGITLPLFSAGGSSSLSIYLALGIVLSVYRYSKDQAKTLFYTK
ncbi:MAG: FtsW/RodA/SpoVE family cell cycle protein [Clostridiales bacterium]|nr:FtsW/RodA/SpoVE family cell cycle protein [Clostridiales bacterium]